MTIMLVINRRLRSMVKSRDNKWMKLTKIDQEMFRERFIAITNKEF